MQNTFADFEPALPAMAWEGIEARMDKGGNRKLLLWWGAAAVAIIAGSAWWAQTAYHHNNQASDNYRVKSYQQENSSPTPVQPNAPENAGNGSASEQLNKAGGTSNSSNTKSAANKNNSGFNGTHKSENVDPVTNQQPDIQKPNEPVQADADIANNTNLFDNLNGTGVKSEEVAGTQLVKPELTDRIKGINVIGNPPDRVLGARWMLGLAVGQIVNQTSAAANPQYKEYIHRDYKKQLRDGEGLLGAMNFNGTIGYRIVGNHYLYSGFSYYQRRNSLNFNFDWNPPVQDGTSGNKMDLNGNYPIKGYFETQFHNTKFQGTNIYTEYDIPLGWYAQIPLNRKWNFIPSVAGSVGFISLGSNNYTLGYSELEIQPENKNWYRHTIALTHASAGLYRNMTNRIQWGLNLMGNYTLTPLYVGEQTLRPRAFTGGITTKLIWRLD